MCGKKFQTGSMFVINKRDLIKISLQILASLSILLLCYGRMLIPHYSVDSYTVAQNPASMYWSGLRAGRPLFIVWYKLCQACNYDPVRKQWIGMLILLTSCALSHVVIYNAVCKYLYNTISSKKACIVFCCLAIIFCNPFIAEWFLYVEISGVYAVSLLLTAFGVMFILGGGVLGYSAGGIMYYNRSYGLPGSSVDFSYFECNFYLEKK